MKQEQIEKIIENLDKKGHHLVNKTINEIRGNKHDN